MVLVRNIAGQMDDAGGDSIDAPSNFALLKDNEQPYALPPFERLGQRNTIS